MEYLQLSLSEQKTANKLLKQQKSNLKTTIEELKAKDIASTKMIQDLNIKVEMSDELIFEKNAKIEILSQNWNKTTTDNELDMQLFGEENENDQQSRIHMLLMNSSNNSSEIDPQKIPRLEVKANQVDDLTLIINSLRDEIDKKQTEIDSLKLKEIKFDTTYRFKEIDNEKDIEILKNTIQSWETNYNIAIESLKQKEEELESEKEVNESLRKLLLKFGEKDDVSEDLLSEFKMEKSDLYTRLENLEKELNEKNDSLTSLEKSYSQLENDYQTVFDQKESSDLNYKLEINELRVIILLYSCCFF